MKNDLASLSFRSRTTHRKAPVLIRRKIQDSALARAQSDRIAQVLYLKTLRATCHVYDAQGIPCAAGKFQLLGKPTDSVPFLSSFHCAAGGLGCQEWHT